MCLFLLACMTGLKHLLSVFLSSLWAVSYAVRLSQSQQCVADTEEKEKRPSGLGHTVATTTRDAARTPLQAGWEEITTEKTHSSYGNISLLYLQWCSFFPLTPPSSLSLFLTLSSHLLR